MKDKSYKAVDKLEATDLYDFLDLMVATRHWADDKGLNTPRTLSAQLLKVLEEMTEISMSLEGIFLDEQMDAIGDTLVTAIVADLCAGTSAFAAVITSPNLFYTSRMGATWKDIYIELTKHLGKLSSMVTRYDLSETGMFDATTKRCIEDYLLHIMLDTIELAVELGINPIASLDMAYGVISKRTGKKVGEVFVKTEDLKEDLKEED